MLVAGGTRSGYGRNIRAPAGVDDPVPVPDRPQRPFASEMASTFAGTDQILEWDVGDSAVRSYRTAAWLGVEERSVVAPAGLLRWALDSLAIVASGPGRCSGLADAAGRVAPLAATSGSGVSLAERPPQISTGPVRLSFTLLE